MWVYRVQGLGVQSSGRFWVVALCVCSWRLLAYGLRISVQCLVSQLCFRDFGGFLSGCKASKVLQRLLNGTLGSWTLRVTGAG